MFGQQTGGFGGGGFGAQSTPGTGFSFAGAQQPQQQPASQFSTGTAFGAPAPAFGGGFGMTTPAATTTSAFGQPQQQTNFSFGGQAPGAGLFGQQASTTTGAFGQPGATTVAFGQPAATTGAFGQPAATTGAFGQPAATTGAFGQPTATTGVFGQPTANTGAFGQSVSTTGAFGQPQATAGVFGQPGTTSVTPSFGGFGSFGAASQPQQTPASFGTTTQPAFGQFGQTGSMFGGTQSNTAFGSSFGGGLGSSQPTTGFGGFGATNTSTAPFSFAQPTFGQQQQPSLFGQPQMQQQGFQLQQQQQQQQPQIDEMQAFQQSIFQCHKFGDERDSTLASMNYLQACWGAGKGYYSQTFPPVNYNQQNPFYRFKAVGYAFMYTDSNEDGQVVVNFRKAQTKLQAEETNIVACLQTMLARPNILIRFTGTKAVSEDATMAIVFAEDRNTLRRVPATDMATALHQPHLKAQLENLGVTSVNPKVKPSPEQLKRYLESPPDGIDPRVWQQAQEDNPDPNSMIPTSLVGVDALKSRIEWQEKETQQHHARLKLVGDDVTTLSNRHANMTAELQQMRRKHVVLTHRLISIICRQELMRKQGSTLQPDEEMLKKKLEEMDGELNSPTQYKGRLNELLSQIRLHKSASESRPAVKYNVEPSSLAPVKDFLSIQQESVKHLVATTKHDFETLKEMMDGLTKITTKISN